ncbi:MAG TPA: rhomboid family intramembrane serine protease [Desulfobacteraceae bacterium]|nr:rhomboid family intramembrane serine protease [Desulfobacteraceae bacterium]
MIPIRDTIESRNYPIVNNLIIATNVLVYIIQLGQGENLTRFILTYALVPVRYSVPEIASYFSVGQQAFSFFSFMFIHGGFWHLLGNMWFLYIFGDNVEDRLGPVRYLAFYILCGLASGISHLFINWHSQIPTIGASGAIAGVMGAYLLLYPKSRILTLIPIFFIPFFVHIPAFFFIGVWFVLQFISAAGTPDQGGGIAWWAHIGGFIFGMIFLKLFLKIPQTGITQNLQRKTSRKKTHRLQVVNTVGLENDPNLYGSVTISPIEASQGSRKLVNIPRGFQKHIFRVSIPPDIRHGTILRLAGMGKRMSNKTRGDLFLKIAIREIP